VRAVFFLLLIANLAYFGWAELVDAPQPVPPNQAYAKLPRLKLVNELPAAESRPSSGSARKTALVVPTESESEAPRCVSIGPFDDQDSAMRGASKLREKGLTPRQRVEKGEISKGFWVYIGGLKTDADVAKVLLTLEQSHVDDAHVMPDAGDAHQVSVGLFSERDRADRRAQSVQKLGLQPEVAERKLPATVFWMDVDFPPGTAAPSTQDVAAGGDPAHLEVTPCPAQAPSDAAPGPPTPYSTPFRTKVAGAAAASKVP
jgi:cell division septation protein DedD